MPLIDTPAALEELVGRARDAEIVALDTEFVWERTFYPRLGLVQVGLHDDDVHVIDAPAIDLRPLGELLADSSVTKILHDAGQDLIILTRESGSMPSNVFDTQLAGGFVGLTATLSLQGLMASVAGVHLDKGATRSDWLQRPLTDEQLKYAREDVRHLPATYHELVDRLRKVGRYEWAQEEMLAYEDPRRYEDDDPRERYQQTRGRGKKGFGGRDYAVLREVTAWREHEARERDRPRGHILKDEALIDISRKKPTSDAELSRIRSVPAPVRERYGNALLQAVASALAIPRDEWPARAPSQGPDPTIVPRLDLAQAVLRGRGEREGVDPQLVANRADMEALVSDAALDPANHRILSGWRREFIGADLEALLTGRAAVALTDEGLPDIVALD